MAAASNTIGDSACCPSPFGEAARRVRGILLRHETAPVAPAPNRLRHKRGPLLPSQKRRYANAGSKEDGIRPMSKFSKSLRLTYRAAMTPFERLRRALCDRTWREWTAAAVLAVYACIWTLFDLVSRRSEDIHFDMAEMAAWSRDLALGSPKHPQMGAWVAGLWFLIFPY